MKNGSKTSGAASGGTGITNSQGGKEAALPTERIQNVKEGDRIHVASQSIR